MLSQFFMSFLTRSIYNHCLVSFCVCVVRGYEQEERINPESLILGSFKGIGDIKEQVLS